MNVRSECRWDCLRKGCLQWAVPVPRRAAERMDSPSSKVGISRRFSPLGVLVPFLIMPRNAATASDQSASPSSAANVFQNSNKNSLGSFNASSLFFFPRPNEDLRRVAIGVVGDAGAGQLGDLGELRPRVRREPEGDVPVMLGEGRGELEPLVGRGLDNAC